MWHWYITCVAQDRLAVVSPRLHQWVTGDSVIEERMMCSSCESALGQHRIGNYLEMYLLSIDIEVWNGFLVIG